MDCAQSFKLDRSLTPIYTGGAFAASTDGQTLYTTLGEQVVCTDVPSGQRIHLFRGDSSDVTTLALASANAAHSGVLLVAHRSLALRFYATAPQNDNAPFALIRQLARAHDAPITVAAADRTGSVFATGSADGIVKVWDAAAAHCTHVFRGHGGVVSALAFDVDPGRPPRLFSASDDCRIRAWDLNTRKSLLVLDGHSSVVRGLDITRDGRTLVAGGRDRVFTVWDLPSGHLRHTIPVYETLEAVGLVEVAKEDADVESSKKGKGKAKEINDPSARVCVWTAGDSGHIRLWDVHTGQQVQTTTQHGDTKVHEVVHVCAIPGIVITAHVDQNLTFHQLPTLHPLRHIVGYNDEVIDTVFLSSASTSSSTQNSTDTHLAVATNSDLIRIYDLETFNVSLLHGHANVVLCLAKSTNGSLLLSGSKDRTMRLWSAQPGDAQTQDGSDPQKSAWTCEAIAEGHLESIGAVAAAPKEGLFAITASQDLTVKVWDIAAYVNVDEPARRTGRDGEPVKLRAMATLKVHDKDINALDIAPNDRLLVTGSQDKTAKLFGIDYIPGARSNSNVPTVRLVPLGILKGHKRGVWSVRFHPADQIIATASGDRSIKLWSLTDYTCLKTFEGHTNTVLKIDFLPGGAQIASCASDGLVKIWNTKDEECVATLDNHEEKIWALTVNHDASTIVSGGADSVINFWQDVTELREEEEALAEEEIVLKQQDLANYLDAKDYRNAIILALSMDQPRRLLLLLTDILADDSQGDSTGIKATSAVLASVIASLESGDLYRLLEYIRDWNARSRDADVAQTLLHMILKTFSSAQILEVKAVATGMEISRAKTGDGENDNSSRKPKATASIGDIIDALLPYTERHYARMVRLEQETALLDYVLAQMDEYGDIVDADHVNGNLGFVEMNGVDLESPIAGR